MGKPYSSELNRFAQTVGWAREQDVDELRHFANRWAGEHTVVVGSGGSFSAALVVALFREIAHHSSTAAVTPLEFISLLKRLQPQAWLLSAEGKNQDILAAARAAESADLSCVALTLTLHNPLVELASRSGSVRVFAFGMDWVKDGYLATNSLLATALLAYRALWSDEAFDRSLAPLLRPGRLAERRAALKDLLDAPTIRRDGLLLLYSAAAKPFAVDLESKLSEAALALVQVVDLRQFAHGRHLQLALLSQPPFVLIACSNADKALAEATLALLPDTNAAQLLEIVGNTEQDIAVAGLLDAMYLTEAIAAGAAHDPGQPDVPAFGRALHALAADDTWRSNDHGDRIALAARRKAFPTATSGGDVDVRVRDAAASFAVRLAGARLRGLVCDFDGTLCRAENRFGGMPRETVDLVSTLIRQGLRFAIATGRGGSLYEQLRLAFDPQLHLHVLVGYYGGSYITSLATPFDPPLPNTEFAELAAWLSDAVPGLELDPWQDLARGGQFAIRLGNAARCRRLRAAIRVWLDDSGRRDWRVFCSGHSVDVLDAHTSKYRVVEHLAAAADLTPATEILRIGDSGQEEGNDFDLLKDGLSLSCDGVSSSLSSCWNYGAAGNNQLEVTTSYLRQLAAVDGAFAFSADWLP